MPPLPKDPTRPRFRGVELYLLDVSQYISMLLADNLF